MPPYVKNKDAARKSFFLDVKIQNSWVHWKQKSSIPLHWGTKPCLQITWLAAYLNYGCKILHKMSFCFILSYFFTFRIQIDYGFLRFLVDVRVILCTLCS